MEVRGESYKQLLIYWAPEIVSVLTLQAAPILFDAYFIGRLHSTSTYGTLGILNNFLHMLIKLSEVVMVATITIIGRHNGAKEYKKIGTTLGDAFWTAIFIGAALALPIFLFSKQILLGLNVPPHMAELGSVPLKLRSIGILLSFTYFALFGFMRGIKNTKTPMKITLVGISVFLILDYGLVLGKFGLPSLKLTGSAIASLAQYLCMLSMCIWHILRTEEYKRYFSKIFFYFLSYQGVVRILWLSIPILIDKISLAYAYIHLNKLINPLGKYAIASFTAVKDLERLAFLPAIAFATVITFLTSNRIGAGDQIGARSNIRKILYLAGGMVAFNLIIICLNPSYFIALFDPRKKFAGFAGTIFPFISILVIFDFIQLILAGVLRGAGDVKTVMFVRFFTCLGFFYPVSNFLSKMPIADEKWKFILIYGSFYINTGLMGLFFIIRLKSKRWSSTKI